MPNVNTRLSEEYLDAALDKMRSVLRELRVVVDERTARKVRDVAKVKLTEAARVFKELREEYDGAVANVQALNEKLAEIEPWERRYRLLQGSIEDVIRGIIDVEELRAFAREYESKKLEALT